VPWPVGAGDRRDRLGHRRQGRRACEFLTALEAPAGTTERSIAWKIENGMGASVKTGA
jgi:hypothetical protein